MHAVNSAVNPLGPQGAAFLGKDRSVAYAPEVLSTGPGELTEAQAQAVLAAENRLKMPASRSPSAATSARRSPSPTPAPATRSASSPRS
jgi:hypothetical protein